MRPKEIEIQARIINSAKELFFENCYSEVTTEQISQKAGISKKTLYRYFISKKEILDRVVNQVINGLNNEIYGILLKENYSYPVRLKEIISVFSVALSVITTHFLGDIQKNAPDIWKKIDEFKRNTVTNHFGKLLDEGIEKGQINTAINKDIAILILLSSINNLYNPFFLRQLPKGMIKNIPNSANEIYNDIIKVLYEGILTENTKKQYSLQ